MHAKDRSSVPHGWWGALLAVALTLVYAGGVTGQSQASADPPAAGSPAALLDTLSRVPADEATLSTLISYVDYRAIEEAGGAERPASVEALVAALEADDPAARAWLDAFQGVASGPSDLLASLLESGPAWPTSAGFDFFEVDRAVQFGAPPADGTVLVGSFRPDSVTAAYEARGFTGTAVGERTLWCDATGCDRGREVDLTEMDPAMPFGGRLGRRQPLAAGSTDLLSSADDGVVRAMLAATDGSSESVGTLPGYRAFAQAPAADVSTTQATFLPGVAALSPIDLLELGDQGTDIDAALEAQLIGLPQVGTVSGIGILGGVSGDEEVVTIALSVPNDTAAAAAARAVAERLDRAPSLRDDRPLKDLLKDAGVTSMATRMLPESDEAAATAIIELRARALPDDPDGDVAVPGRLYRLFTRLVMTRDLAWLAPYVGSR